MTLFPNFKLKPSDVFGGALKTRVVGKELLTEDVPLRLTRSVLCRLPFRLRLGASCVFEVSGAVPARIRVRNLVDFPTRESVNEALRKQYDPKPEMASDLLVTLPPVSIPTEAKDSIYKSLKAKNVPREFSSDPEDAPKAVNRLLVQYRLKFAKEIEFNRVRRVSLFSFFEGTTAQIFSIFRRGDSPDYGLIDRIADTLPLKASVRLQHAGPWHDLPKEKIEQLRNEINDHRLYYDLVVQAQDFGKATDYLNELFYAVIALESAHSEFLQRTLKSKSPDPKIKEDTQNLLREAGISTLVRLTPFLFISEEHRPSIETLDLVKKAITIRNEIAHSKPDETGNLGEVLDLLEKETGHILVAGKPTRRPRGQENTRVRADRPVHS